MGQMISTTAFTDLQLILAVKLCLVIFIVFGLVCVYARIRPWIFVLATGAMSATAYLLFTSDLGLMFWGLQGDEVTIAAMYNTFAHRGLFSDFGYHALPPFYPPLFFWFFGLIGRIMDWNGVLIAKFASASTFFIFPIATYALVRGYRRTEHGADGPGVIAALLAPLFILVFIDQDAIIGKPYELVTAMATVLWAVFLFALIREDAWSWKRSVVFGATGGILFMTYYLWIIFAGIALVIATIGATRDEWRRFSLRGVSVVVCTAIASLPYLGPLLVAYTRYGAENWQQALFMMRDFDWSADFFSFGWIQAFMLVGLLSLIVYRAHPFVRPLLFLFVTSYVWWAVGLVTVLAFQTPLQGFRGFFFFNRTILAFAAAFLIERLWVTWRGRAQDGWWQTPVMVIGLLFLATHLFFGAFIDDPIVVERRAKSRALRGSTSTLVQFLNRQPPSDVLTLQSTIPELPAFVPINNFIYYNQHNSHPAAGFSLRRSYVQTMALARDPQTFATLAHDTPYGPIDRLILFRDQHDYVLYLHLDAPMQGIQEDMIKIPVSLVTEKYFQLVYEQDGFFIWERKKNV